MSNTFGVGSNRVVAVAVAVAPAKKQEEGHKTEGGKRYLSKWSMAESVCETETSEREKRAVTLIR